MVAAAHDVDPVGGLHPDLISAVVRFSERHAEYAAAALDALVADARRRGDALEVRGLPIGFLMEMGAIMQLQVWEITGVQPLLPVDLPSVEVASKDLNARVQADPRQFDRVESAKLSNRLLHVWLAHFSWTAPAAMGVDVVIGQMDEDVLVEAIAQLLWNNRRAGGGAN